MSIVYLAIIEFALVLAQPPVILAPFTSLDACMVEAAKNNQVNAKELYEAGAAFVCLESKEVRI